MMPKQPDLLVNVRLSGEYMCVLNEGTERETRTPWFDNLVLDSGLDRLGQSAGSAACLTWCSVGTGTATPAIGNTSLGAYLASSNVRVDDGSSNLGTPTWAGQCTVHHTFTQGAVVGNITEIGMGWASGGVGLFSRTLIVNGAGTPVALPVTALDVLTVYYRVTCSPVLTDLVSSVAISGSGTHTFTARPSLVANFQQALGYSLSFEVGWGTLSGVATYPAGCTIGAITTAPSGAQVTGFGQTAPRGVYTPGNFYVDSVITWPPLAGNAVGGVQGLVLNFNNYCGRWQYVFDTVIPKDNTKTMTLTVRYAWGR